MLYLFVFTAQQRTLCGAGGFQIERQGSSLRKERRSSVLGIEQKTRQKLEICL